MTATLLLFRGNRRLFLEGLIKRGANLHRLAESLGLETDYLRAVSKGDFQLAPHYRERAQRFLLAHLTFEYMMAS